MSEKLRIADIVKATGVSKSTLFRYELEGKISKVKRDGRGWRQYAVKDRDEIVRRLTELDLI